MNELRSHGSEEEEKSSTKVINLINALSHPPAIKMCLKCFKNAIEEKSWSFGFVKRKVDETIMETSLDTWVIRR